MEHLIWLLHLKDCLRVFHLLLHPLLHLNLQPTQIDKTFKVFIFLWRFYSVIYRVINEGSTNSSTKFTTNYKLELYQNRRNCFRYRNKMENSWGNLQTISNRMDNNIYNNLHEWLPSRISSLHLCYLRVQFRLPQWLVNSQLGCTLPSIPWTPPWKTSTKMWL